MHVTTTYEYIMHICVLVRKYDYTEHYDIEKIYTTYSYIAHASRPVVLFVVMIIGIQTSIITFYVSGRWQAIVLYRVETSSPPYPAHSPIKITNERKTNSNSGEMIAILFARLREKHEPF